MGMYVNELFRFAEVMTGVLFLVMVVLLFTRHPMFMPGWSEYFKPG